MQKKLVFLDMEKEEEIELIERYLANELSESEGDAFNRRLVEDKEFSSTFREMHELVEGIKHAGRKNILAKLEEYESKFPEIEVSKTKLINISKQWYIGIAASIMVVVASSVLVYKFSSGSDTEGLYKEFYTSYPNIVNPTQRNDTSTYLINSGFKEYDLGNYEAAVEEFQKVLELSDGDVLLYLGLSYMEIEKYEEAIIYLEKYLQTYTKFEHQTNWYLALALIKINEVDKASSQLQKLTVSNSSYADKAKVILNQLE
jgi:tetratricopeptide (TPR) repeat protein